MTRDGRLVINEPEIRRRLIEAIESYTAAYHEGCTPPDAVDWDDRGNNQAFLAQTVVMTTNNTLSIPNAIKVDRSEDYYDNTTTIEWPLDPSGKIFPIEGTMFQAVVFKDGDNLVTAEQFVRFLVAEGWLMHYLNFSGERMLPSIPALLDQPFWLDPKDRHRMVAVMQAESRPTGHNYGLASGDLGHDRVFQEHVWAEAIHRIAAEGITPEQAVDEAITRVKQILNQ